MNVRAARPGDEPALAAVRVRGWQVAYAGLVAASHLDSMSVHEDIPVWESLLADRTAHRRTLVIETGTADGPRVVGFCSIGPYRTVALDADTEAGALAPPGTVGEVYAFYLHPDVWGTGLADELMHASLRALDEDGWPLVRLWVLAGNTRARRFYGRHGWTPDGEQQTLPIGGDPVEVRLHRSRSDGQPRATT